jgi:hypothetical protein
LSWAVAASFVVLGLAAVLLGLAAYSGWYFRWEDRQTQGAAYYARPLAERRRLKRRIRAYSLPVHPFVRLLSALRGRPTSMPSFEYEGVCGPTRVSSPEVFAKAKAYRPRPEDIFVVTQMRCGTTWMQQVVYEIVSRGCGDLSDRGHRHLYAMSPWLDGTRSVSLEAAPLVGEPPARIIKSHLPVTLCPYDPAAKYVYVTRHPVSCFGSIVDYQRALAGWLMPPVKNLADWFCSDRMYWLPWPRHVEGWWRLSRTHDNVLFVHFEEMTRDLGSVLDRVAAFFGRPLQERERQQVLEKCSFEYMRSREELFEMSPPTMFSVAGRRFMVRGPARRDEVSPAIRARIVDYCREALRGSVYPVREFYPDLAPAVVIDASPGPVKIGRPPRAGAEPTCADT